MSIAPSIKPLNTTVKGRKNNKMIFRKKEVFIEMDWEGEIGKISERKHRIIVKNLMYTFS